MINKFTLKLTWLLLLAVTSLTLANAQTAIYENDFSDGFPAGWTTEDENGQGALWDWCDMPETCILNWTLYFDQHDEAFLAETADNGFMYMDSDALGPLVQNHKANLTTTAFDFSGQSEVWVKFESLLGVFENPTTDLAVLRVSTDGTNWTAFNIYDIAAGNTGNTPGEARWTTNGQYGIVDITTAAAGESTVYLQWSWEGNYEYYWLFDDLAIYDADPTGIFIPATSLRLINGFYAAAPNAQWPLEQVEPFGFVADIDNIGSVDQTNVNLNITIRDAITQDVVYTADNDYGTVAVGEAVIDQLFTGIPYLPTEMGVYEGKYTLTSDSTGADASMDANPEDNTVTFDFAITENLFAKETQTTAVTDLPGSNWDVGEPWSWAYGNYFYVKEGAGKIIENVEFAMESEGNDPGEVILIKVYTWEDANADEIVQPGERISIGFAPYILTGDEDPLDLISVEVTDALGDPIPLMDETEYLVMMEYVTDADDQTLNFPYSDETNYGGMVFWSQENGAPRYASVLATAGDLETADFSTLGFGYDVLARVRMTYGEETSQSVEVLDAANNTRVFPNPAQEQITLEMDFVEPMSEVLIHVFDITGKLILSQELDQVQSQQVDYNLNNFNPGTYMFHIQTDAGVRTERFTVVK